MRNMGMCAAVLAAALGLAQPAAGDGMEGLSDSQQKALAQAQEQASAVLGEDKADSGMARVLSTLYQQLFNLKDAKRKNAAQTAVQKSELKAALTAVRNSQWISESLSKVSDEELLRVIYTKPYPIVYYNQSSPIRAIWDRPQAAVNQLEGLKVEQALIEDDIKDVEARIKDLTERLIREEKGK